MNKLTKSLRAYQKIFCKKNHIACVPRSDRGSMAAASIRQEGRLTTIKKKSKNKHFLYAKFPK